MPGVNGSEQVPTLFVASVENLIIVLPTKTKEFCLCRDGRQTLRLPVQGHGRPAPGPAHHADPVAGQRPPPLV